MKAIIIIALVLAACGGGGDMEEKTDPIAEPPCKSVPVENRAAECGT